MANKDESVAKKQKVAIMEVKFKLSINWIVTEGGNIDTATIRETLDMQPEAPSEGTLNGMFWITAY